MTAVIRQTARNATYEFTAHAEAEMLEDDIDRLDVRNALNVGRVVKSQRHGLAVRHVVVGKDTEARTITVVVEVEEDVLRICVVTTWRGK